MVCKFYSVTFQEAISVGQNSVILSSEETQTPHKAACAVGVQTLPGKRSITRTTHPQPWDTPQPSTGNPNDHLATQVKKVSHVTISTGSRGTDHVLGYCWVIW